MKKRLIAYACVTVSLMFNSNYVSAQETDFDKNNIKLNLFSLPMKNISLQYERGIGAHMSVSLGLRLQPKGSLPFQSSLRNSLDATDTAALDFVNNARMSNWAITPEFRYYFGKKPLNGFYIAPFIRFGGYNLDWSYKYTDDKGEVHNIAFTGNTSQFGGGILFGAQWHLGSHILLDWWILGPMYSSQNLNLKANTDLSDLSAQDKSDLLESLQSVKLFGSTVDAQVSDKGASVKSTFGMPGLRTGLCIGFSF